MNFHQRRFDRAAETYGDHSEVQAAMARILIAALPPGEAPKRVLEMGCGTGHLTMALRERLPNSVLLATDTSERMLESARERSPSEFKEKTLWCRWDAEKTGGALPGELEDLRPFDLAASNALIQWFHDLEAHFSLMAAQLHPGGGYLVSGFFRDNFPELNSILREQPFGYRDFPGHDWEEVRDAAFAAGFEIEDWREETVPKTYASAGAFLSAIRGLGSARRPEPGKPLTRGLFDLLKRQYQERYPEGQGVRATWRPWYALLRLKT